jgi:signal transduction histidine kinase
MIRRFVIAWVALAASILSVIGLPLAVLYSQGIERRLVQDITNDGQVLRDLVSSDLASGDLEAVRRTTQSFAALGSSRVVVVDPQGRTLIDTSEGVEPPVSDRPETRAALAGFDSAGIREATETLQEKGYSAMPVVVGNETIAALRVSEPSSAARQAIRQFWLAFVGVGVVVVAVAGVGGYLFGRWAVRPVAILEQGARRLAGGDLSSRSSVRSGPTDLRRLGRTFDEMASRLEILVRSQQQFVADASHQLRTPLTALRLRIESLEESLDDERSQRDLDAIVSELDRLTGLVDGLLAVARAEAMTPAETLEMTEVLDDAVERWSPVAEERGVTLRSSSPPAVKAVAATGAVPQILDNLIDNAINASPEAALIDVDLSVTTPPLEETVVLRVRDRGPGMRPEEMARATDRFWRAPGAPPGGTGLGLAIASELARASGGELRLERPDDGPGLVATVVFSPGA